MCGDADVYGAQHSIYEHTKSYSKLLPLYVPLLSNTLPSLPILPNPSLGPRPPLVLPSVCVHNNTRERKAGEKRGRPGSIHHVNGHEVDVGGEGPIFKYIRLNLKVSFLPVKTSSFHHAKVWSPKTW